MSNERTLYWMLINDQRYCGFETLEEVQYAIAYFKASGCKDKLDIEADYEAERKG